jgi:hypothetical protein
MSILVPPSTIFPDAQPSRTPYQVLDIAPEECDPKVIEDAALRCSSRVRAYQLTCEVECVRRLNEIAQALITLLDRVCRGEYDRDLVKRSIPTKSERRSPAKQDVSLLPRGKDAPSTPEEGPLKLHLDDRGACDVRLVYRKREPVLTNPADVLGVIRRRRRARGDAVGGSDDRPLAVASRRFHSTHQR